jgi:hypothetical protein
MAVRIWKGKDTENDLGPEHFDVTWEGSVLRLREYNGHDDSDFYAIVWDAEAGEPREAWYATTRGWTYNNSATVDATPEVRAAYDAYARRQREALQRDRDAAEAEVPRTGRRVKVVKGRKVPAGAEGTVFWYGKDKYAGKNWLPWDDGRTGYRVGFETANGEKFFTAATNVEVTARETAGSE